MTRSILNQIKAVVLSPSILLFIKKNLFFILAGFGIALSLFYSGISVHFEFRLRGDAWSYMEIAQQFTSFSEALHYVGARTLGFPLFDYLFLYLDSNGSMLAKVNHICLTLFIIHELTVIWVWFSCIKIKLFTTSSIYFGLLFLVLSAYPAMVMHTTTPLTDVFGMDLLLIGFSLFAWVINDPSDLTLRIRWGVTVFSGLLSGAILGYAILVRPSYWPGVVGFLTVYILMTGVSRLLLRNWSCRQSMLMCIVAVLALSAVIIPVMDHCNSRYHTLCLQDPKTFNVLGSTLVGLSSARTPWSYTLSPEGVVPSYPDTFLVKNFHHRCPLTSVMGRLTSDNSNLLSCMYHAPQLVVVYFIKKMTGFFDTFRMTPYTELSTPSWYIWMARFFSSIAFVGFWILLWEGAKGTYQLAVHRKPVSALIAAAWSFCIIQVSAHSILHVEERYAFPWIPFCIIAFFLKVKAIQEKNHSSNLRWMWLSFAVLVIIGYFIQVSVWDYGMSHQR